MQALGSALAEGAQNSCCPIPCLSLNRHSLISALWALRLTGYRQVNWPCRLFCSSVINVCKDLAGNGWGEMSRSWSQLLDAQVPGGIPESEKIPSVTLRASSHYVILVSTWKDGVWSSDGDSKASRQFVGCGPLGCRFLGNTKPHACFFILMVVMGQSHMSKFKPITGSNQALQTYLVSEWMSEWMNELLWVLVVLAG